MTRTIGIDGCPFGWIGVAREMDGGLNPEVILFRNFQEILDHPQGFAIIAIDMPIGLPDRIVGAGRGPEQAIRPLLGKRKSSVFSIPSRSAVEAPDYKTACEKAFNTSLPARKIAKQSFNIFPKILEIDTAMTPALEARVFEMHPELALWRLNNETPLVEPKKGNASNKQAGFEERRDILLKHSFTRAFLEAKPPRGAARDDFIDACAGLVIAERILQQKAQPFPANPARDAKGLRIAIWA